MKKRIGFLVFVIAILLLPKTVLAEVDDPNELIFRIASDGENLTYKGVAPKNYDEAYGMINTIADRINDDDYQTWGDCDQDDFTKCSIHIEDHNVEWEYNEQTGEDELVAGWAKDYDITITYDEPSSDNITKYGKIINGFLNSFDVDFNYPSTYFKVEDMSLINYYVSSDKSELWRPGAASRALKFSTANKHTNGADISYELAIFLGEQGDELMYETAGGDMIVFYNGYAYAYTKGGVYLRRVIYIPSSTDENPDAYVAAAQKRINDYLGPNNIVTVSKGGSLTTIADDIPDTSMYAGATYDELLDENVDESLTDGNYYNVKVGNRTYKFYIIKSDNIPGTPVYNALNIATNISISSTDSSVPLDTSIIVKKVNDSTIKSKIGTDNYISYDISLFSDATGAKVEQLENGKFKVSIPVPAELKDKTLTVYYISDNTLEEHEAKVEKDSNNNLYAVFETNHFSQYTLAEKVKAAANTTTETTTTNSTPETTTDTVVAVKTSNPKTSDNILTYVTMFIVSGIACTIILNKKLKHTL